MKTEQDLNERPDLISAKEINEMLNDSLFTQDELKQGEPLEGQYIKVFGITRIMGLHPERVKAKLPRLQEIIKELHPKFFEGYTFLALPFDKNDKQWGEQINAEELYILCKANDLASFTFSRDFWPSLPGGVPYIHFFNEPTKYEEYQAPAIEEPIIESHIDDTQPLSEPAPTEERAEPQADEAAPIEGDSDGENR